MKIHIEEKSAELIKELGENVYVVGGYVRNALCGYNASDLDISGPLPAAALNLPSGATMTMVNHRMGTAQIDCGGVKYEYTPFRTEVYGEGGGHTPVQVFFTDSLEADAVRRDFCANAVYYDVRRDELIDPLGGLKDIERKILRGCNKRVFESDGLRLLRLVRLAAQLDFKIEGETASSAKANAKNLEDITTERKRAELEKILTADVPNSVKNAHYRALKLLTNLGLWKYFIPEIEEMNGVPQPEQHHKYDVMEHTFRTVLYSPVLHNTRLAALFHDIGKPYCYKNFGNFHGHERNSQIQTLNILNRLRFPKDVTEQVARLCALHMYDMDGKTRQSKVRVFVAQNYDIIQKLVALIRADRLATGLADFDEVQKEHRFEKTLKEMMLDGTPILKRQLRVSGKDLADIGFESEAISNALAALWRECVINPVNNNRDWLLRAAERYPKKIDRADSDKNKKTGK